MDGHAREHQYKDDGAKDGFGFSLCGHGAREEMLRKKESDAEERVKTEI